MTAQPANDRHLSLTHQDRTRYLVVACLAAIILCAARYLQPSPTGVGTHEQLGLPPCPFLLLTGIPCLSCGLTTSFAHAARLHFYESLITQPFGLILFWLTVLSIPLSLYFIHRHISWSQMINRIKSSPALYGLIAIHLLSWIYKITAMQ
jgi:hypothetical protein